MAIVARTEHDTGPKPPEGQHAVTCCDVVDIGMVEVVWEGVTKQQHKIDVMFWLGKEDDDGKPYIANRRFTLTMSERGALRPFLEAWRGKPYTEGQALQGIDVEKMVGVPAYIQIQNNEKGYPRIVSVMGLPEGLEAPSTNGYTRLKDRGPVADDGDNPPPLDDDDDLPF